MIYIYSKRSDGGWQYNFRHVGQFNSGDDFGYAVDISGDKIVVGAPGMYNDFPGGFCVYSRQLLGQELIWDVEEIFEANGSAGCNVGATIAIHDDEILTTGCAQAFSFKYNGAAWVQASTLVSPSGTPYYYGNAINLNSEVAIVGDPGMGGAGAAHIFRRTSSGGWAFVQRLTSDFPSSMDYYASSIGLTDNHMVLGAPEYSESCNWSGSAFVYDLNNIINDGEVDICTGYYTGATQSTARSVTLGNESGCTVTFQPISQTLYRANTIRLLPGVSVLAGAQFRAMALPCPFFNNAQLNEGRKAISSKRWHWGGPVYQRLSQSHNRRNNYGGIISRGN